MGYLKTVETGKDNSIGCFQDWTFFSVLCSFTVSAKLLSISLLIEHTGCYSNKRKPKRKGSHISLVVQSKWMTLISTQCHHTLHLYVWETPLIHVIYRIPSLPEGNCINNMGLYSELGIPNDSCAVPYCIWERYVPTGQAPSDRMSTSDCCLQASLRRKHSFW